MKHILEQIVTFFRRILGLEKAEELDDYGCLVVWNSATQSRRMGGVAISTTQVLFVCHYAPPAGTTLEFASGEMATVAYVTPVNEGVACVANIKSTLVVTKPATIASAKKGEMVWIVDQFGKHRETRITDDSPSVKWQQVLKDKDSGSPVLVNRDGTTCVVSIANKPQSGPRLV